MADDLIGCQVSKTGIWEARLKKLCIAADRRLTERSL
jgi:hypothetical protein